MSFHRLDLPAMHISAWDNLKDISDQNFVVVNVQHNELDNFDHFGTHPYLLELDVRHNRICNFLGLTRQVSLRTLHLSGNVIVEHPYYRIMALLVIGYSLKSIDGVDVSEEEVLLTQSIPSHAALAISYGWLLDLQPRSPESFQQIISDCQRIRAIHRRRCKGHFTVSHALKRLSEQLTFSDENVTNNEVNRTSSNLQEKRNANNANKEQKEELALKEKEPRRSNIGNDNVDNKRTLYQNQELHDASEHQQTSVYFTNAEVQTISCFEFDNVNVIHNTKLKETPGQWWRCKLQLSSTKVLIFTELQSYEPAIEFALCTLRVEEEESTILRLTTKGSVSVRLEFDSIAQMTAALKCIRILQHRSLLSSSSSLEQPFHVQHYENNLPSQEQQTTQGNLHQNYQEAKTFRPDNIFPAHKRESKADQMQHVNVNDNDENSVEEIEFEVDEENEEHETKEETLTNEKTVENNIINANLQNDTHMGSSVDSILFCSDDNINDNVNSNNNFINNVNDNTRRDIFATHVQANNINSIPNAVTIVNNNNIDNMNDKREKPQIVSVDQNKILAENVKPVILSKDHSGMKKQIRHRKQKLSRPSVNAQSSSDSSAPRKELSSTAATELSTANIIQSTNALHNNNSSNATPLPAPPISLPRRATDKIKHSLPSSTSSSFVATFPVHKDNLQTTLENTNSNTTGNTENVIEMNKTPEVPATHSVHNSFASSRYKEENAITLSKPSTEETQLANAQRKVLLTPTSRDSNTNAVNLQNIYTDGSADAKNSKITNTNTSSVAVNTAQKNFAHSHQQQLRHQEFRNIVISSDSDEDE